MRSQQRLVTISLLIVVVFIIGIFVGSAWQNQGSTSVESMMKQSELSAESFLIEQDLFETFETSCELTETRLASLSDGLWQLGKRLEGRDAEQTLGESNYDFLKRKFHLMQIRTYILYKEFLDNCDIDQNVILFYFTRDDEESQKQGQVLDSLVDQYDLKVFAVEQGYSKDLEFLEDYYGVSSAPFLVVNYVDKLPGFSNAEMITPLLHGRA